MTLGFRDGMTAADRVHYIVTMTLAKVASMQAEKEREAQAAVKAEGEAKTDTTTKTEGAIQ